MARNKVLSYNGQGGMNMTTGMPMEPVDPRNTMPLEKKEPKKSKAKGKPSKSMKLA